MVNAGTRHVAQLAAGSSGDDRVFCTPRATIILDGASSHTGDQHFSGGEYADALGHALIEHADDDGQSLPDILGHSIAQAAGHLSLRSLSVQPSSTVAVVRLPEQPTRAPGELEVLVLGDSVVVVGMSDGQQRLLTDERLANLALPQANEYRQRMQRGHGFDERHRAILSELQLSERRHRNVPGGYWIASDEPAAANEAVTATFPVDSVQWVVLASDGVADVLEAAGLSWEELARLDSHELASALADLHTWEAHADPDGMALPRSKRHDDKAIAVVHPNAPSW
ncbi:hypothetical protein [Nocardia asteroides]|uniref:hypothetical protein n=1 Tax=Nocardia asteroides TaxID=1824 RepID=UPI0033CDFD00